MALHRGEIAAKLALDDPWYSRIEEAYSVFDYPKPTSTEVCVHCCMDREVEDDFFAPDIRDLPLRYVQDWFFAAYNSLGIAKETWGYLLPRILEILSAGEVPSSIGLEVSLNRFRTGDRENWSAEEWQVLDRFQRQFLRWKVENGSDDLDGVLCMFRLAGWSLTDLFDQVAGMPTELLAERFWRDWCEGHVPGREDVRVTAFWKSPDNSTVFEFYTSSSMFERLTALGVAESTNSDVAQRALEVAAIIEAQSDSVAQPSFAHQSVKVP